MIDSSRLERSLIAVAQKYAPTLVPANWRQPGDYPGALPDLARALARESVLVMIGDTSMASIKTWTDGYISLYSLLTSTLFPSHQRVNAFYLDQQPPPIVALYGDAIPVIMVFAGYVVPYVVARQGTQTSEVEISGLMDMILEELEATNLGREEYRRLRDSGAVALRHLLESGVRQFPLTPAARPILDQMAAQQRPPAFPQTPSFSSPPQPQSPAPSSVSAFLAQDEPPVPHQATPPFTVPIEQAAGQQPTMQQPTSLGPSRSAPPPPADLPEPPPPPPDLPETLQAPPVQPEVAQPEPAKRRFDPDSVPIFFNPQSGSTNSPAPPVPPLRPRDKR